MASLHGPFVRQLSNLPHELRQHLSTLLLLTGPKVRRPAHPVQVEAVEIITLEKLADQCQGTLANCRNPVIQLGTTWSQAPQLGVLLPERAVGEMVRLVAERKDIHPHGDPGRDTLFSAASDPDGVRIESTLVEHPEVTHPAALGLLGMIALPDALPTLGPGAIVDSHSVGTEEQVRDLGARVLVDEFVQSREGHLAFGPVQAEAAIVLVDDQARRHYDRLLPLAGGCGLFHPRNELGIRSSIVSVRLARLVAGQRTREPGDPDQQQTGQPTIHDVTPSPEKPGGRLAHLRKPDKADANSVELAIVVPQDVVNCDCSSAAREDQERSSVVPTACRSRDSSPAIRLAQSTPSCSRKNSSARPLYFNSLMKMLAN